MKKSEYKIVLADPSPIILQGMASMIAKLQEYKVVMQTTDLRSIAGRMHLLNPDILIVNPIMIDYAQRFMLCDFFSEFPGMKWTALVSTYCDARVLKQYHGIIEINDDLQCVKSVLAQVVNVDSISQEITDPSLSDREREVLILLVKGFTNKKIALQLNLSVNTVNTHRKNIIRKTGIKSVSALTVYAILNNLIEEKDII